MLLDAQWASMLLLSPKTYYTHSYQTHDYLKVEIISSRIFSSKSKMWLKFSLTNFFVAQNFCWLIFFQRFGWLFSSFFALFCTSYVQFPWFQRLKEHKKPTKIFATNCDNSIWRKFSDEYFRDELFRALIYSTLR